MTKDTLYKIAKKVETIILEDDNQLIKIQTHIWDKKVSYILKDKNTGKEYEFDSIDEALNLYERNLK